MLENEFHKYEIKQFIELLFQYAQDERLIDINRCLLAKNLYFDVCSLYNYILFNFSEEKYISENIITFSTLKKFIQINLSININDEILSKLFNFYSSKNNIINNNERYLEYIQFVDIFYPRYNLKLRRFLQQRNGLNNYIKKLDNITKQILQKLFIGEINKIKNIDFSLKKFININGNEIFKIISNNKKIITKEDLINFINLYYNQNEINYKEEDINSIIYSLSLNRKYNNNKKEYIEGITE